MQTETVRMKPDLSLTSSANIRAVSLVRSVLNCSELVLVLRGEYLYVVANSSSLL